MATASWLMTPSRHLLRSTSSFSSFFSFTPVYGKISTPPFSVQRIQHLRTLACDTSIICSNSISQAPRTIASNFRTNPAKLTSSAPATARLALLSRHLSTGTPLLSTGTSTPLSPPPPPPPNTATSSPTSAKMSSQPTLLIPGPIEFDDAVLGAMSHPSQSHVGAPFVNTFGETLSMVRKLFISEDPKAQPLVVSGSGTLGWDFISANLVEPGDDVLVLHTGYFADSFADCLTTYGAVPTQLKAPIGSRPSLEEIESALSKKSYKAITITHTDTSTGVLSDIKAVSELVRRVSPNTLVIVDGVCSVGCEEIRFDDWGLDAVLTASQKAIGVPAGLCIVYFSGRAIERFEARKAAPGSYFASLKNWLPIMRNYEAKKPSYFATPSPQLIHALHTSLKQILSIPLEERFAKHKEVSRHIKDSVEKLGLKQLASDEAAQANGMTAIYLPEGVTVPQLLPKLLAKGVVFAGGLHKEIAAKYFRFGHMGVSVMQKERGEIEKALMALSEALKEAKNEN